MLTNDCTATTCKFQYIICRWFKISASTSLIASAMFQYIICRWFNKLVKLHKVYLSVSIHYMSLVQITSQPYNSANSCFNTLYVVGSTIANDSTTQGSGFQYIICRWFKYYKDRIHLYLQCFNTLYVVGSNSEDYLEVIGITFQYIICRWFKFKRSSTKTL